MFDTVCTFPLESELFAQAVHPSAPLVAVGLTSGHVAALKLPPIDGDDEDDDDDEQESTQNGYLGQKGTRRGSNGTGVVDTAWRTKRHKGSCRCLAYSHDGRQLYSAGTDGIVKAADSETGRVTSKLAIPRHASSARDPIDGPTVMHALSPQTLLLATDSGALHVYDVREPAASVALDGKTASSSAAAAAAATFASPRPAQTYHPHADLVSSLAPLPPTAASTSGFSKQWLTTGSTTLAVTDLRRGVLAKSEDQEQLLLAVVYVTGLAARRGGTSQGEKAVVGGDHGVLTLWEKGQWDDQDERIVLSRGQDETLDCLARVPDGVGGGGSGTRLAVGTGDGRVCFVRLGVNKVVAEVRHDDVEGVMQLGFDGCGRMISGGGRTVKVWQEHIADEADGEAGHAAKRDAADSDDDSDADGDSDQDSDSSDEEEDKRQRRKKRRKGRGAESGNVKKFDFAGID